MESYPPPPPPPPPLRSQTNGLGIAGFVVSLVGFVTCGVISPIALILSLIALKKEPRGFAIAGTVIGGLGTLLLAAMVVMVVALPEVKLGIETGFDLAEANAIIEEYRQENDALPSEEEGNDLIAGLDDAWGNPLRYELDGERHVIRSAGADGEFDTNDDITVPPRMR
jgi:hypothetical protein